MSWGVTPEAIKALDELYKELDTLSKSGKQDCDKLKDTYTPNKMGLGHHTGDIEKLLKDIEESVLETEGDLKTLSTKVIRAAAIRRHHIEKKRYTRIAQDGTIQPAATDAAAAGLAGSGSGGVKGKAGTSQTGAGAGAVKETGTSASGTEAKVDPKFEKESFSTDLHGFAGSLDLGDGEDGIVQLSGRHKEVQKKEPKGYESHHIPSAAALKQFGIDTDQWPTIALTNDDHAKTDSYRGRQRKKFKSFFPDAAQGETYKGESIEMIDTPGGFVRLVEDEILNIKEACGDRYDGAIKQYVAEIERYVQEHGIPKRSK